MANCSCINCKFTKCDEFASDCGCLGACFKVIVSFYVLVFQLLSCCVILLLINVIVLVVFLIVFLWVTIHCRQFCFGVNGLSVIRCQVYFVRLLLCYWVNVSFVPFTFLVCNKHVLTSVVDAVSCRQCCCDLTWQVYHKCGFSVICTNV